MLRLIYVVLISAPIVFFYVLKSKYVASHINNYSEKYRYSMARHMVSVMKFNGRIHTKVYGIENMPKEGGYVMYPNHQGKYDVLGIIHAHVEPCTFVIDKKRSGIPFAKEFTKLLTASELDKTDMKSQVKTIENVIKQVKNGRKYIIFPEGGYSDNNNTVHDFMPGTFKCSLKSKTPIVPIAIIDSYKVFGVNSLKPVSTQVHFLKPIYYEDYKDLTTKQIASMVKNKIENVVNAYSKEKNIAV